MKIVFAVFCLVIAPIQAYAAIACSAGTATAVPGSGTNFVKTTFTPACSANVDAHYLQDATNFAVQAGSAKGRTVYGGTTKATGSVELICSIASSGRPAVVTPTAPDNPC